MIYFELRKGVHEHKYSYYQKDKMIAVNLYSPVGSMIFQFFGQCHFENLQYFKMISVSFEEKAIRIFLKNGGKK